jgi:nitrate/nitrite transport system substrate-binding protein
MRITILNRILVLMAFFTMSSFKDGKGDNYKKTICTDPPTKKLTLEKRQLNFGFIKLTDMAPLAIAKYLGYFEDEGLEVILIAQANWTDILNKVLDDELDGAHMLAGQPIAAAAGCGRHGELVTPFSMDLNGNAITVSNEIWSKMVDSLPKEYKRPIHPITSNVLKPVINFYKQKHKPMTMGIVANFSTHNYQLRYWLAAGGINPGQYHTRNLQGFKGTSGSDIDLNVTAPPKMPAALKAGEISAYCVGEPWNQEAVYEGIGVPVITSREIYKNHGEKLFVLTKRFVEKYPNTTIAITKALIKAGKWLDDPENRKEAARILSKSAYVDGEKNVVDNSMLGTFEFEKGDIRSAPDFNIFFRHNATYPFYSDGIWYLTQMRRWGQIEEPKPDSWYHELVKDVYRPDIWEKAARLLLEEGFLEKRDIPQTDGYRPPSSDFIDNKLYDGKKPLEYIKSFSIGNNS